MSRFYKRRISYLPTFFSISLVLFLAGLLGFFVLNGNGIKEKIREDIALSIYFKDTVSEAAMMQIRDRLKAQPFVKDAAYISKEEGAKNWPLGKEGVKLLGFNPIPNSIDVHFQPGFVAYDSLNNLKASLEKNTAVRDVDFDKNVVENIDFIVRRAGIILASLALLFSLVSIALINNAIRLNMYSRRFLIKSMQLVGATKNFIRRPFILTGIITGAISALFAATLLIAFIFFGNKYSLMSFSVNMFSWANESVNHNIWLQSALIMLAMLAVGVLITGLSSYFAINKYLKLKLDDLF
jgi:cell division transport system permease protein